MGGSARERKNEEEDDERKRDDRDSEGGKSCAAELLKNLFEAVAIKSFSYLILKLNLQNYIKILKLS